MDPTQNDSFDNAMQGGQSLGYNAPVGPSMNYTGPSDMSITPGVEDIVLNTGTSGNKSKKWWIVGGVVAVLALCAIGGVLLFTGGFQGNNTEEIKAAWNTYYDYLMYGENSRSDGESVDDVTIETWYPAIIGTSEVQDDEEADDVSSYSQYYDNLREKYDSYSNAFSQEENDSVLNYNAIFKAFYDYNMMKDLENAVVQEYGGGNIDGAKVYIDGINDDLLSENTFVDSLYDNLKVYLRAYLSVFDYYNKNGCNYLEANYTNCPEINSSDEVMTKLSALNRGRNNLEFYYNNVYANYVFKSTLLMDERIKEEE